MVRIACYARGQGARRYERHQPEKTLLYQIIKEYYPQFLTHMERQGRSLPLYVRREFDDYLECGLLEHGFLRVRCEDCHHERLVAFSCTKSRRFRRAPWYLPQLWCQAHG
jgi:hypothetical protein